MKKFFLLLLVCSCTNSEKSRKQNEIATDTLAFLKGNWQSCNSEYNQYKLIEFSDSLYGYVEEEQYTGPLIPTNYSLIGDSLRWHDFNGYIYYIDSVKMVLITRWNDTIKYDKVYIQNPLRNHTHEKRQEYSKMFFELKDSYNCK